MLVGPTSLKGKRSMKIKYSVLTAPYPPALVVNPLASVCLVKTAGLELELVLAYIPDEKPRDSEEVLAQFKRSAESMNQPGRTDMDVQVFIRLLQSYLEHNKGPLVRDTPAPSFGADFGNWCVGERRGSFSNPQGDDGWY